MVLMLNGLVVSRVAYAGMGADNTLLYVCLGLASGVFGILTLTAQIFAQKETWEQSLLIFVKTAIPGAYLIQQGLELVVEDLRVIPAET